MPELDRAGLGRRAVAFLINFFFVTFVPFLVTLTVIGALAGDEFVSGAGGSLKLVSVLYLEGLVYFTLLEARSGRTIGKRLLNLRVVALDGGPVTLKQALIRNVLRIVDGQPGGFFLVAAVMVVAMPGKQRLGDRAAETAVVHEAQAPVDAPERLLVTE